MTKKYLPLSTLPRPWTTKPSPRLWLAAAVLLAAGLVMTLATAPLLFLGAGPASAQEDSADFAKALALDKI